MPTKLESLNQIAKRIAEFRYEVELHSKLSLTDIHKHAERLFCAPLSLVLGGEVTVLEYVQKDYPAIDLYCEAAKTGIQVTSTNTHPKIQHTLDETRKHLNDKQVKRVIVLIIGDKKNFRNFNPPDWLSFSPQDDIWDMADLLTQIEKVCTAEQMYELSTELDYQNKDRTAMALDAIQTNIKQLTQAFEDLEHRMQPSTLHLSPPHEKRHFLHEKALALLKERLKQEGPIFIIGPKGIGKKTLAAQLGSEYKGGIVHYVRFRNSFTDTIIQELSRGILSTYDMNHLSENELCRQVLLRLRENDLLIIHDALLTEDFERNDTGYAELCEQPIKLVITTEQDVSEIAPDAIRMTPLEQTDDLLVLMPKRPNQTDELKALIREADNHPGMVRRLAEALKDDNYDIKPAALLDALRSGTLNEKMPALYQQFCEAAPVSGLKKREQSILRCLLLVQERMAESLFRTGLDEDEQGALDHLKKMGWLTVDTQNRLRFSSPVIRLVSRTELQPSYGGCRIFLDRLAENAEVFCRCHDDCAQIADCVDHAVDLATDPIPLELRVLAEKTARLAGRNIKSDVNDILYRQIKQQEDCSYQDFFYLALTYAPQDEDRPGDIKKALRFMNIAITTATEWRSEKGLPLAPAYDLALLYHNYAWLCERDKDLNEAERHYVKAYQLMSDGPQKAETCIQLSQLYLNRGQTEDEVQAYRYAQEAVNLAGSHLIAKRKAYAIRADLHFSRQEFDQAHDDAVESLRIAQTHLPSGDEILNKSFQRALKTSLKLAAIHANAANEADTHPDAIESCFEQAQHYAEESLTYADATQDIKGKQDAYNAIMYAYHQAIRGKYRHQALAQAEAYIQEATTAFHKIPAAYRGNLTPLVINLAKLYQAILLDLSDPENPEAQLETWFRIWKFCAEFECLCTYARETVYPQIIASADRYGRQLRTNLRSNLQILLKFYKHMTDFFTENGDKEQSRLYFQQLMYLDDLVSAAR